LGYLYDKLAPLIEWEMIMMNAEQLADGIAASTAADLALILRATNWLVTDPDNSYGRSEVNGLDIVIQEVRHIPDDANRHAGSYFGTGGPSFMQNGDPWYTNNNAINVHDYDLPGFVAGEEPDDPFFDTVPLIPGTNRVDEARLAARNPVVLARMASTIIKTLKGAGKLDVLTLEQV
jgi:hypothetical protein